MNVTARPRRYGVWIALAVIVAAAGYYYGVMRPKTAEKTTLETSAVTRGSLVESISSTGTLSAAEEVTVGSQVSGIVTKVLVDFNSEVKAGQLMAVVDPQTLQAQLTVARAAMSRMQTNYDEAVRQLEEGKPLREQGYLSIRDLRTLEVAVRTSKAQLDSAVSDYNKQNVQLQYAEIRSPINGVVMSRTVDPGNTVQASMQAPTLFVVASDLRKMKILANVDETQIASIKDGMKAHFTVSGIANKVFNASVRQVRLKSTTTNNVVTYTVVLDADNSEKLLFPGMTATIDFIVSNIENALLIPNSALRMRIPEALRVADTAPPGAGPNAGPNARPNAGPNGGPAGGNPNRGGFAGFGGPPGAGGGPPRGFGGDPNRGLLWMLNAEGKAYRVPVRIIGSDLTTTAVQSMRPDALKEGDMVVTRVVEPKGAAAAAPAGNNQNRNVIPGGFGGGGFPGGGGGGGGGPPR